MSKYKQGEVLAITYDVWISGTKLGMKKKACITSVEIKETVDGADSATIEITDPEFRFIEDNIFIEDNRIKIKLGWDNTTYRITFKGYISAIDINFDNTGIPKLTLTCMDNTHLMNRKKKSKTYKNSTSAEVVKKIVKSYGYTCVIEDDYDFTKQETITQSDQTDIDFIVGLAGDEVHPFTARLVGDTFYYVKKGKLGSPKMTLTYKKFPHEIISFNPKINKETKKEEIKSASVNTSNKSVNSATGKVDTKGGSATKEGKNGGKTGNEYLGNGETGVWTNKKTGKTVNGLE